MSSLTTGIAARRASKRCLTTDGVDADHSSAEMLDRIEHGVMFDGAAHDHARLSATR